MLSFDKVVPASPPKTEPPQKKGKKPVKQIVDKLKRRDRFQPEFEESSDEEDEDKKDFDSRAVKQVKPPIESLGLFFCSSLSLCHMGLLVFHSANRASSEGTSR